MNELIRRLFRSRTLAVEILLASLFVNTLFLASPIYVIQILSRYIGYGFDGTLYTLTSGMLIALVLWLGFTVVRTRMCAAVSGESDRALQTTVLDALSSVKSSALERIPQAKLQEITSAPQLIQNAYEASRIVTVLDMPYFLLFFLAILFLSPLLAVITLLAVGATVVSGALAANSAIKSETSLREQSARMQGSVTSAIQGGESVRAFNGQGFLRSLWKEQLDGLSTLRERILVRKSRWSAIAQGLSMLLKVSIYAVGAKQVVMGDMTVGTLIGVSILSSKALQISSSFMQTFKIMGRAAEAKRMIDEFISLPRESVSGTALKQYTGRIEFKDVSMAYPGATGPLFESLSCTIEPGAVVGVLGKNGAGKTTLSKLLASLLDPVRGQILADGVDLRQISSQWWRRQIMYLPQEPTFLNGTFKDNITMSAPDIDGETLNGVIRDADLKRFFDASADGIETVIKDGGRSLPLGVRKRLALARALVGQGRLAIFDEPTEGLDAEGCEAVIRVLAKLSMEGGTIVVVSRDPNVVRGFTAVIDLNSKPVPKVGNVQPRSVSSDGKA